MAGHRRAGVSRPPCLRRPGTGRSRRSPARPHPSGADRRPRRRPHDRAARPSGPAGRRRGSPRRLRASRRASGGVRAQHRRRYPPSAGLAGAARSAAPRVHLRQLRGGLRPHHGRAGDGGGGHRGDDGLRPLQAARRGARRGVGRATRRRGLDSASAGPGRTRNAGRRRPTRAAPPALLVPRHRTRDGAPQCRPRRGRRRRPARPGRRLRDLPPDRPRPSELAGSRDDAHRRDCPCRWRASWPAWAISPSARASRARSRRPSSSGRSIR